jgi:hypothetical protein
MTWRRIALSLFGAFTIVVTAKPSRSYHRFAPPGHRKPDAKNPARKAAPGLIFAAVLQRRIS